MKPRARARSKWSRGGDQTATVGQRLEAPFVLSVVHSSGEIPLPVSVTWSVVSGGGTVAPTASDSDEMLQVQTIATLGETAGTQVFRATLDQDASVTVDFSVTAEAGRARNLEAVSGARQEGEVGRELAEPFVVRATDEFGNPVEGMRILWSEVGSVSGEVAGDQAATDSDGIASARATLGEVAGMDNNRFVATSPMINEAQADFVATALPGPAANLEIADGNNQAGVRGEALPLPLRVRVGDRFANPVEGVMIAFTSLTDGATVAPDLVATDAAGEAEAVGTLGLVGGGYQFRAEAAGVGTATFNATAFPPLCSDDDWCWVQPVPQGNTMNDAWSVTPNDVWVVGDYGTILRWNGVAWEGIDSNTTNDLNGVIAFEDGTAVAVGDSALIIRYDGNRWRPESAPSVENLNDVWGLSPNQMWAVGDQGTMLRYDGTQWSVVQALPTTTRLNAVFGFSSTEVFAAGDNGTFLTLDVGTWRLENTPTMDDLNGLWGTGPDNVWAVGDRDTFLRWSGVIFQTFPQNGTVNLRAVWGTSATEVYAVGDRGRVRRYDGFNWRPEVSKTANDLFTITGLGTGVFAAGEGGTFVRRPDSEWLLETSRRLNTLQGVWGTAPDEMWAVGELGTILSWNGTAWSEVDIGTRSRARQHKLGRHRARVDADRRVGRVHQAGNREAVLTGGVGDGRGLAGVEHPVLVGVVEDGDARDPFLGAVLLDAVAVAVAVDGAVCVDVGQDRVGREQEVQVLDLACHAEVDVRRIVDPYREELLARIERDNPNAWLIEVSDAAAVLVGEYATLVEALERDLVLERRAEVFEPLFVVRRAGDGWLRIALHVEVVVAVRAGDEAIDDPRRCTTHDVAVEVVREFVLGREHRHARRERFLAVIEVAVAERFGSRGERGSTVEAESHGLVDFVEVTLCDEVIQSRYLRDAHNL